MVLKGIICLLFFSFTQLLFAQELEIRGAGASFPAPLYKAWFKNYSYILKDNSKVTFDYQPIGSGLGVNKLLKQTVDFGASDIPMSDYDLKKSDYKIIHIPCILGAIAIIYNHPTLPNGLKLSATVLSEIFRAKILKWNHYKIQALNPNVLLPDDFIKPVVREDHSGTSQIIRRYLRKYGFGKNSWRPTFKRAKGSQNVSDLVSKTKGSLGYINLSFAKSGGHKIIALQNRAGQFLTPAPKNISLAASKVRGSRVRVSLLDQNMTGAYPLTSFTFLLLPNKKNRVQKELRKFTRWALSYGQRLAPKLHYAPVPKKLAKTLLEGL